MKMVMSQRCHEPGLPLSFDSTSNFRRFGWVGFGYGFYRHPISYVTKSLRQPRYWLSSVSKLYLAYCYCLSTELKLVIIRATAHLTCMVIDGLHWQLPGRTIKFSVTLMSSNSAQNGPFMSSTCSWLSRKAKHAKCHENGGSVTEKKKKKSSNHTTWIFGKKSWKFEISTVTVKMFWKAVLLLCTSALRQASLAHLTRFSAIFTHSGYFHLTRVAVRWPYALHQGIIHVDRRRTKHFLIENVIILV